MSNTDVCLLIFLQFTLCHVLKGNKPDFHNALTSEKSEPMYLEFLEMIGKMYTPEKIKRESRIGFTL